MDNPKAKNIAILLTEVTAIFLMVFNLLPRETSLFLTGILVFYFIFSPLEDSLWVFIASIPLFVALPITESFETMANWRILLAVLFLIWLAKSAKDIWPRCIRTVWVLKTQRKFEPFRSKLPKLSRLAILTIIFLSISTLSLLVADNLWLGIKKLLFLINIFLLYIIIKNLIARNQDLAFKIFSAIKVNIGLTLGIGFFQLAMVFFVNLHQFWHLWDRHVINVFYGQDLSNLLSYSNTWFSYYAYQLPTLRMFSVFPDSHSFAFFCVLALPCFLTTIFLRPRENREKAVFYYFFLIVCLLAIIFSGSRGAWVSALISSLAFLLIILFYWSPTVRARTNFFKPRYAKKWSRQIQLILGTLIIFFILFPIASAILFMPQYIQLGQEAVSDVSLFERAKSVVDLTESSVKGRLEIWQRTIDSIIIHPLWGVGLGNYPLVLNEPLSTVKKGASAHNLYLDVAAEIGIFGLLVLVTIFGYILKDAWQFFIHQGKSFFGVWAGFFLLALIWIFSYSLFDVALLNDKVFLFFMANLAILYGAKSSFSFYKSAHS